MDKKMLNWKEFLEKGTEQYKDIVKAMKRLEKNSSISNLESVISEIKKESFGNKNKADFDVIWEKLEIESNKIKKDDINWWDIFFINRGKNNKIRKIIEEIERADNSGKEKDLNKAIESISKLDKETHEYDINVLNRRIRILEKRIDRRVSENFGSILASLREQKGLSLAKLGEAAGISASYINRIELNERKTPSYPIIEKLAEALDVNINTLLAAAGANVQKSDTKSLRQLIFSNNISINDGGESLDVNKKEELIKIIDYISDMEWDKNKHLESLELFDLINHYKDM